MKYVACIQFFEVQEKISLEPDCHDGSYNYFKSYEPFVCDDKRSHCLSLSSIDAYVYCGIQFLVCFSRYDSLVDSLVTLW